MATPDLSKFAWRSKNVYRKGEIAMPNIDYNKQYDRRQRVKRTLLATGIDIGADFDAIAFMNKDGNVLAVPSGITLEKSSTSSYG
jgi:hypothetical protein